MITVVGSLNMDFVVSVDRRPKLGETISSNTLNIFYGGKGGNQGVSTAKISQDVSFIGAVGNDPYGSDYIKELEKVGIRTDYISVIDNVPTGMAMITIENKDNSIIYSEGANGKLTSEHDAEAQELIAKSDVVIVQFEVSNEVISTVLDIANDVDVPVILNPAPYRDFPISWLDKTTYITPNETEYEAIINGKFYDEKYKNKFIITLGKEGAAFYEDNIQKIIKAPKINVQDTTGAGDTFNGVMAHYISVGESLEDACTKAVYAASLSTTKLGAQSGMPTKDELETFIEKTHHNGEN